MSLNEVAAALKCVVESFLCLWRHWCCVKTLQRLLNAVRYCRVKLHLSADNSYVVSTFLSVLESGCDSLLTWPWWLSPWNNGTVLKPWVARWAGPGPGWGSACCCAVSLFIILLYVPLFGSRSGLWCKNCVWLWPISSWSKKQCSMATECVFQQTLKHCTYNCCVQAHVGEFAWAWGGRLYLYSQPPRAGKWPVSCDYILGNQKWRGNCEIYLKEL